MASLFGWLIVVLAALAGGWWWLRRGAALERRSKRRAEQAAHRFARDRELLADRFLAVASRTGKPRGLHWTECRLSEEPPLLARDAHTGELYALAATEVSFEAIAGGDMEEVEAVGSVRGATAVFVWRGDRWDTDGRVVFNLEPGETLERFAATLTPV